MDAIGEQFEQIQQGWEAVYETLQANPTAAAPQLGNATVEQVNEVMGTIGHWFTRVRAPHGYKPGFHVARALASTSLVAAGNAIQGLQRGEYAHFNALFSALNQILSALHSMLVFSDKQKTRDAVAELGGKIAEALALVDNAQRELERKTIALNSADRSLQVVQKAEAAVANSQSEAEEKVAAIQTSLEAAQEHLQNTKKVAGSAEELKEQVDELLSVNKQLASHLQAQGDELEALNARSREQSELIGALLPRGASAGLASAFAQRVGQLEATKWIWAVVFLGSIAALVYLGYKVLDLPHSDSEAFWRDLLRRLPLAAPAVWLGWFSAIQFGNTLRVQEDYAFKATSKAFAGYRDHMDHMASVSGEEGSSAMALLANRTIEILAREPLRLFGRTERDASPSHSVLDALRLRKGGSQKEESPE